MKSALFFALLVLAAAKSTKKYEPVHPSQDLIDAAEKLEMEQIGRIVGGENIAITDAPWQVSLRSNGNHICGAAIVNSRWVVSAAHCTQGSGYSIRVGSADRLSGGQVISVISVINHPNYNSGAGTYPNDISLLQLASDIEFGNNAQPIELASTDFTGQDCLLSGWGRTSATSSLPVQLQGVVMPVISHSECGTRWGRNNILESHICVFSSTSVKSACNGDSGGPLVCTVNNTPYLAGVTSWGENGCYATRPSVYTRISSFSNWISANAN